MDAFRDSLFIRPVAVDSTRTYDGDPVALAQIQGSYIALQRGEMGKARAPYDTATQLIERVIDEHPDWPYPWYVLGLIQLEMYRAGLLVKPSKYHDLGSSYREAAIRSWAHAVEADSAFLEAETALAHLIVSLGHRTLPQAARTPLEHLRGLSSRPAEVNLALSRLDFDDGAYAAALNDVDMYLRAGGDTGVTQIERARFLMALGRRQDATDSYLAGLGHLSDIGRASYREDIAWIAGADELAKFDSLPPDSAGPWIAQFWRERAALDLREPSDRLAEHLRRWVYVHIHFLLHRPDDVTAFAEGFNQLDQHSIFDAGLVGQVMVEVAGGIPVFRAYRRTQWEVDDRGVIYLRHGEPSTRVGSASGFPNETWAYDLPVGRRVFDFIGSRALGTEAPTTLTAALPLDADILDARSGLDAKYGILAFRIRSAQAAARGNAALVALKDGEPIPESPDEVAAFEKKHPEVRSTAMLPHFEASDLWREVAQNRTAIAAAVTGDGFPQHFRESLHAIVNLYGVGIGAHQGARILAVFAIPAKSLVPVPRTDRGPGVLYPLRFRFAALDRAKGTIRQLDSTHTYLATASLLPKQYLLGEVELLVPPGCYQARLLIAQPHESAGTGAGRDSIPALSDSVSLGLSDIIVGRQGSGLVWRYDGHQIPLNPLSVFPRGGEAELFYEVVGLTAGREYTVTTSLRKLEDRPTDNPLMRMSFDFTAHQSYEQVSRNIDLSHLKPNRYLLVLAVQEVGATRYATRSQRLNIVGD
ncbi:MAG TPA: hypothetical protein VMG41_10835 [Gemmatimonadales bacterium]|nr:hypothetical protein [Gemmatimonadales bacterium]